MRIAIMQPYLFPYIGYVQLVNAVDVFVLYDDVNFINKGWINRNKILVNGNEHLFTIPLKGASQNKLIKDIELDNSKNWRGEFIKMLERSYAKAPMFKTVFPIIENIIYYKTEYVAELIIHSVREINKYLDIETKLIISSKKYNNVTLRKQARIIDICQQEDILEYINPIGGLEIYSKEEFLEFKIKLHFLKSNEFMYKQFNNEFVPWLSIIDVMMFNSVEQIKNNLDNYQLI